MRTRPFRFGIVVSRFNAEITEALLRSCQGHLAASGAIEIVRVPGGFEIPWAVHRLAASGRFDAIVALGCVLRGKTPQNDHISRTLFEQLHQVSLATGTPCILGVLTPNTWAQAKARTRGRLDRGREAAQAALEMAQLRRQLDARLCHGKA